MAVAEILEFYQPPGGRSDSEWSAEGRRRFWERMVLVLTSDLFENETRIGSGGSLPNQPISHACAVLAVGIYQNDAAMF